MRDWCSGVLLDCRKIWEGLPEDIREKLYFFNSFFWTKLSEKAPQGNQTSAQKAAASFERVKRWTRVCSRQPSQNRPICTCLHRSRAD